MLKGRFQNIVNSLIVGKGNGCEYRHSPESLKTTTTCKEWLDNKCNNKDCPLRHPSGVSIFAYYCGWI